MGNITVKTCTKEFLSQIGLLSFVNLLYDFAKLKIGFIAYWATKRTPAFAYQSMVTLFCKSRGISNDFLSRIISFFSRQYKFVPTLSILGDLKESDLSLIDEGLRTEGYYVFTNKLPPEMCQKLLDFTKRVPAKVISITDPKAKNMGPLIYNPSEPVAVKYEYSASDLIEEVAVQRIITDQGILKIAQNYLGTKPILDIIALWWNTAQKVADKDAAQYFHFDMDRLKWLKFFFYITDVKAENGPHEFIAGSHRRGGIPPELLRQGYARLTDEEVKAYYESDRFMKFTGPQGTILVEDTRGLHKGNRVETGDRLIFQIEFTNSLFGGKYTPFSVPKKTTEELISTREKFPAVFKMFN